LVTDVRGHILNVMYWVLTCLPCVHKQDISCPPQHLRVTEVEWPILVMPTANAAIRKVLIQVFCHVLTDKCGHYVMLEIHTCLFCCRKICQWAWQLILKNSLRRLHLSVITPRGMVQWADSQLHHTLSGNRYSKFASNLPFGFTYDQPPTGKLWLVSGKTVSMKVWRAAVS
jgi:hypothetical protein